tara:strand:- start:95 stop:1552 length:1458 start_codon:yes stop_codon:yes gene_type:complete
MNKLINSIAISNSDIIDANGSTRVITISGEADAKFTLTIKNGSGNNILEDYLENVTIPKSGLYKLKQKFPIYESNDFTRIDNTEVYTIEILPGSFTKFTDDIVSYYELKQYPNPTITITSTSSHAITGSDSTLTGKAMKLAEAMPSNFKTSSPSTYAKRFGEITNDITISPETDIKLYISKKPNLALDLKKNTDVKRNIGEKKGVEKELTLTLPPSDTAQYTKSVKEKMTYSGSYTYTKLFDSNVNNENENKFSSKIKLTDTENLVIGMIITGNNIKGHTTITSVDTDTNITISLKQRLTQHDQLTFTKNISGVISGINSANNITTDSEESLPSNVELTFTNDITSIHGRVIASGSGTDTITLNSTYQVRKFGKEDVTFTQLTDNFISTTPNTYTQYITTTKDTAITFDLLSLDIDTNKGEKTPTWEAQDEPSHGTITTTSWAAGVGTTIYTPHTGYTGTDKFYFYVNDATPVLSERTPIYITIT